MLAADYGKLLPPLEVLVRDYSMDPEAACQLYRPLISELAPPVPAGGDKKAEDGAEEGHFEGPASPPPHQAPKQARCCELQTA